MSDLWMIIIWWFYISLLGIVIWPMTWRWFEKFWDRGYGLTKMFGLAAVGWLVWIVALLKISTFSQGLIWLALVGVGIGSWLGLRDKYKEGFWGWMKKNLRIVVFYELLFLGSLAAWATIRGYQPDIEGLEKFMDFGFVNSILRSQYFPPADMWWSGGSINYYYFGHYLSALLTKLSGIDSAVSYNLSIAHLFAMGITGAFCIGSNLVHQTSKKISWVVILAGLVSAFLVNLGGNFHTIYTFFKPYENEHPVPPWKLDVGWNPDTYWYPNATRFIEYTIHEFPIYSYVVADLHGHVSDIPFVIAFLGLILMLVKKAEDEGVESVRSIYILPSGFLLGIMLMTNYWDLPIYGLIFGVTFLILGIRRMGAWNAILDTLGKGMVLVGTAFVTALGFIANFKQIAEGIKFVNARSQIYQLVILYGWPIIMTVLFLVILYVLRKKKEEFKNVDNMVLAWILVAWFLIILPEIIYVKDIYIAEYHRANTMFKLVYQSFIIFALSSSYVIFRFLNEKRINTLIRGVFRLVILIGLGLTAIYPWLSVRSYYGGLKDYKGLYGMRFLESTEGDLAAIHWIKKNINGQPVMLEAPGDSYTTFNRVSAMTGLPTVVGWAVHEWLWRGEGYDPIGSRISEVETVYTAQNMDDVLKILNKYGVEYVFVGDKEREKYPTLIEENISQLGEKVFEFDETRIYKIN